MSALSCKPAIERLAVIMELLSGDVPLNCSRLAERFEISTKTAQRDIEFIRDRLGVDLEYNQQKHVYELVEAPPQVQAFLRLLTPQQQAARRRASGWLVT